MFRRTIYWLLVKLHILDKPDLIARTASEHPSPEDLKPGLLVVVKDGAIEKWACMRCPGGCGEKVMLPLSKQRRPHWRVWFDWFHRASLEPSVHQANECRCHFWVKTGKVVWCDPRPRH
ncbi:MAG TPA: DUF6527 family protein [Tepidisphaeraceae bacterium]|nr:DUF6527 family protein [Tepidisphaeraceae bacterium]